MEKEDLIQHIRVLEHNWQSTLASLNNSAKYCKKLQEDNESLSRLLSLIEDLSPEELINMDKHFEKLKKEIWQKNAKKVLDETYNYGQDYFVEEPYMEENDFNQMLNELANCFSIKLKE